MKLKKQDIFLLAGLLAVFLILGAVLLLTRKSGATVVVRVAGEETATFALEENTVYTIEGVSGGTNKLVIEDGAVWLEDASCPDQLCVHQGKIQYVGESIICLPNKVSVTIEGEPEENGVDVIAT
ncbi:MAG: NusG domain II-containing protein [Clostridia bacterium]|nr:NusG domain II-containing protein [Clostridia bacterium]